MMKHEFEKLAGYEVSDDDYSKILEPMYMAVHLNKQEFVRVIDRKRFALMTKSEVLSEMKTIAIYLHSTCEHFADSDARRKLDSLLTEYKRRFWDNCYIATRQTGDDYGCPGRGCSYPSALVVLNSQSNAVIYTVSFE